MLHAVAPIYGIIFLTGIVRAFYRPANVALGTDLLPKELYANGSTWRISVFHTGMVIGPALGGLAYAWRGPVAAHAFVMSLLLAGGFGCFHSLRPDTAKARTRIDLHEPGRRAPFCLL